MFWLARPPYLRRVGAGLAVVVALWFELVPEATVLHPFAKTDLTAGATVTPGDFEMRVVPPGILPGVEPDGVLATPLARGEPLTPGMIAQTPAVPAGWWALDVPIPAGVGAGTEVRLVVDQEQIPRVVIGLVVRVQAVDDFDGNVALVAVPEADAAAAASAVAQGSVAVLVGSGG